MAIEVCTGKALMDGNLKMKTFGEDSLLVVNHETDTIYNDVIRYDVSKMDDAQKNYNKFPEHDATLILRGSDG